MREENEKKSFIPSLRHLDTQSLRHYFSQLMQEALA